MESIERETQHSFRRRGLLAGAAALAAGALAARTAQPVSATGQSVFYQADPTQPAINNYTARTLGLYTAGGPSSTAFLASDAVLLNVDATFSSDGTANIDGIRAHGSGAYSGVVGYGGSGGGDGVLGLGSGLSGGGVVGVAAGANNPGTQHVGVYGTGFSAGATGVYGISDSNYGVYGFSSTSNGVDGNGVIGVAGGGSKVGVSGTSTQGTGVYGVTTAGFQYGVLGTTTAMNSTAIAGIANQNGSSAFSGGTTNANAFAGVFQGTVVVQGNFAVSGNKSAVVAHPRTGDHRLVYCVESPESWFEDFGEGTVTSGRAEVTLDPDFAALVHTEQYHVFLTPAGESKGLYVTGKTASGFVVQEQDGGKSSVRFSWRVVGKRKDIGGERLAKFTMPNLPLPDVSKLPKLPEPSTTPKKP